MNTKMTSINTLQKQIKDMGIREDDTVVIHSSLRAVGKIENGADGIIDAFCGYLKNGLFIVPTHTWATVTPSHPVFYLNESVPCVGTLPTVAAGRKDGIRSCHPTHSVMAFGKRAAEYVAGEEFAETPTPTFGCWGRLKDEKAKILLASECRKCTREHIYQGVNRSAKIELVDQMFLLTAVQRTQP